MLPLTLLDHERAAISSITKAMSERAKRPISIDQLIRGWEQLIGHIERGYDDSIYEYMNDVATRTLINELLTKTPPSVAQKLKAIIEPVDRRFLSATRAALQSLTPVESEADHFWLVRVPLKLPEELKNDLLSAGLIDESF